MRKVYLVISMLLCGWMSAQAAPITKVEARQIAQQFIGINDDTADDTGFAPYYIFSRGKGQGYVIVSGDDTTAPIIGYTEQGDFNYDHLPDAIQSMLNAWAERISQVQNCKTTTPKRSIAQRLSQARKGVAAFKANWVNVDALIKTHWKQDWPYNNMAPLRDNDEHCLTGCVATAGSQVAYYFHKDNPSALQYDTPTYGYGCPVTVSLPKGTPIEWDQMLLSGGGTSRQNTAVATLMYALGTSAGLTYGSSTSGHNYRSGHWNMADALRGQFNLDYKYKGKWECSQQQWEEIIYSSLTAGKPMLYSGAHDTQGGHSVVLDGYQASTGLFHFNFGWGGQGDGWYTVDDETGMNGFHNSQDLVYDITPMKPNLKGTLDIDTMYQRTPSIISVDITNNGTLSYSGFYLYLSNSKTVPSSAADNETSTVIAPGATKSIQFKVSPQLKTLKYAFLCDKNKNIIDSCQFTVLNAVSALSLNSLSVEAGTEQQVVDKFTFKQVNNTTAYINVTLTNGEGGTYCRPIYKCMLESYNSEQKQWTSVNSVQIAGPIFQVGEKRDTTFAFENLRPGTLYRAFLNHDALTSNTDNITFDTPDSVAFFTVQEPTLNIVAEGRHAVVSGNWDQGLFYEKTQGKGICSFDITNLEQLSAQPRSDNPNILLYAATSKPAYAGLHNIIVDGQCEKLVIQSEAEFKPKEAFTAQKATYTVTHIKGSQWNATLVPFTTQVPYGMQAKIPTSKTTTSLIHTFTTEVEAMTPIVFLSGHDAINTFTSENVTIGTDTVVSVLSDKLKAYTVNTQLESNSLLLGSYASMPYYLPIEEVPACTAFMPIATNSRRMSVSDKSDVEAAYTLLAATIQKAYDVLVPNAGAPTSILTPFMAAIKQSEDALTYRSLTTKADIETESGTLSEAITTFLEGLATGISPRQTHFEAADLGSTTYYNLSGLRIDKPAKGIVLMRKGNQTKKIIIK